MARSCYFYNVHDMNNKGKIVLEKATFADIKKFFGVGGLNVNLYLNGKLYKNRYRIEIADAQEEVDKKCIKNDAEFWEDWDRTCREIKRKYEFVKSYEKGVKRLVLRGKGACKP